MSALLPYLLLDFVTLSVLTLINY